uniref:Uncharacterized protein n=1 Tax=Cannabis sativa TaxID=3483 RepID=A0A803QCH4_CANSA
MTQNNGSNRRNLHTAVVDVCKREETHHCRLRLGDRAPPASANAEELTPPLSANGEAPSSSNRLGGWDEAKDETPL